MNLSQILKKELSRRKEVTASYSLRKFAQDLGLSPAQLSQLMSEKRNVTKKTLQKIETALTLTKAEIRTISGKSPEKPKNQLKDDHFRLIADWYHIAILSLAEIKGAKADPRFISRRLNITLEESNEALFRLRRLGLIKINDDDSFEPVQKDLHLSSETKNESIQKFHTQNLRLAEYKLKSIDPDKREYSSMTMAIDPAKIKRARALINQFKDDMAELLEKEPRSEVYQLSIQLFPLSDTKETK